MSDQKTPQGGQGASRAPRTYRVLHSAVDGFYRGAEITADLVGDIKRLLKLGAVERVEEPKPAAQE